jgi:hypothetical protein
MTVAKAHAATIGFYGILALFASALAVAAYHREPTVRRSTLCMSPADRASVAVEPATAPTQVLARLREIRRKAAALAPPGLDLDSPPAPGSHAELDALVRDLISDLDLAAAPTTEEMP